MSDELVQQTQNAFDLVQKLYFEISYLFKEFEVLLQREEERFIIARPSGYAVTTRTSAGLEPVHVDYWMPKTFTVFFIPEEQTEIQRGQTITPFANNLKMLLFHIEVLGKSVSVPNILTGYIENIESRQQRVKKVEHMMSSFAYRSQSIFANTPNIDYVDSYSSFTGSVIEAPLFSINNSPDAYDLVLRTLELYRNDS